MRKTKLLWRLSGWFLMAALFLGFGSGMLRAQNYILVTDASTLEENDEVLIVSVVGSTYSAMSAFTENATSANPFRGRADISVVNNTINNPDIATSADEAKACVFTLKKNEEGKYAFYDKVNEKYIKQKAADGMGLISSEEAFYFSVDIVTDASNRADIYADRYVRYSTLNSPFGFKMYGDNMSQTPVYLYKKDIQPYIQTQTGETAVTYKVAPETNLNVNLAFSAGNLTDGVTVSVASNQDGRSDAVIAVNKTTLTATEANEGFELTLTSSGLAVGKYTDIITFKMGETELATVTVNLLVREPDVYQLVTKAAKLKDRDTVLIVGAAGVDSYRAMGALTMIDVNQGRIGVTVTVTDNAIVGPEIATEENDEKNAYELTLVKNNTGNYAFHDNVANKYIQITGSRLNNSSLTTSSYFSITIDEGTGAATIGSASKPFRYDAAANEFQAIAASDANNPVYIYKKQGPEIIVDETFSMTTVEGSSVSETLTVKGTKLENDVTVSCPEGNFTVSPATLTKEDVMSENGGNLTITFNAQKLADTVELTLTSGELTETITVTAMIKPDLTVVATLSMNTIEGTPVSEKVTVKGTTLKNDVTVACPEGNFSVSPATLDKDAVMSENGTEFTVTFNGEKEADTVELTLACGELTKTITVTATATPKGNECEAPANLKARVDDNNVTLTWEGEAEKYRVVVLLGADTVRNEVVTTKLHELNALNAGTYSWAVASVCEDGEQWADGEDFEAKEPVISANEAAEGLAFRIYPNPTADVFYVEVAESARMEIFTVGGVMIRNAELTAGKNEIRLDHSGIYFVRLTGAHGAAVNRVIVK